jgi:hypothetical protein
MQSESDMLTRTIGTFGEDRRTVAALIRHLLVHDRHPPMRECHRVARHRPFSGMAADMRVDEARHFADRNEQ